MDNTLTLELFNRAQAWAIIKEQLYPFMAHWLQAGKKLVLTVKLRTRTAPQNRRYWGRGVLAQISEQATVGGKLFAAETWHEMFKRRFVGVIELPSGEVVGMSTKGMTTAEFCLFCDQVEAFACTDLGVCFVDLPRLDG